MSETKSSPATGMDLLWVMFVGLKLTNHIDWSWWWVLAPLWVPLVTNVVTWSMRARQRRMPAGTATCARVDRLGGIGACTGAGGGE